MYDEKLQQEAVNNFGLTSDPREAGYLLRDGTFLDFSGKNDGGPSGKRAMDHREIGQLGFERDNDEYLIYYAYTFMRKTGAIRWQYYPPYVLCDWGDMPSDEQLRVTLRYGLHRDVVIDFINLSTAKVIKSYNYARFGGDDFKLIMLDAKDIFVYKRRLREGLLL